MNDNNHNTPSQNPESRGPEALYVRPRIANIATRNVIDVVNSMPDDATMRDLYYQPSHPAVPAATHQVVSNIVELAPRTKSLPADSRSSINQMPMPIEPSQNGEVVDMEQYRMIQDARDKLNAA